MRLDESIKYIQQAVQKAADDIGKKKPATKKYMVVRNKPDGAVIYVPEWFPVFEHGRGKRKSTQWSEPQPPAPFKGAFEYNLYRWMRQRGMLKGTPKQQANQAKGLRYLINKKGNKLYKQTNNGANPIDIYTTIIDDMVKDVTSNIASLQVKAISDIIKTLK